ncbi:MAG: hypothetical protein JSS70_11065 [Bacteroidetes bacterium]|nr:hypothetical protein [Bacteroidota bacterium]
MSYLDIPRIHFGGRFFTDPSTVNNDPTHYDPAVTVPSPWQNPKGQHRFQFRDCLIKSAVDANGFISNDPVIGAPIISTDKPDPARIVDLDVYQQGVPTIYGLQLQITVGSQTITGTLDPAVLNLIWFNSVLPTRSWHNGDYVQDSYGGDMNACGGFQSVLRLNETDWPDTSSDILNALRDTTLHVNNQYLVSLKFVVDGYQNVPQDSEYLTGRIVGTLGPLFENEPLYNPGQRWLMPRTFSEDDPWNSPSFNNCPFKVDTKRNKLVLDLANSICRKSTGGPPVDLGTLSATVVTPEPVAVSLGTVDYSEFAYDNNAHITEISLNAAQIQALQQGTLNLSTSRTDIGALGVLTEPTNTKIQFAVEQRPFTMAGDPGTTITTRVYISEKGIPLAGKKLALFLESVHGNTPGATVPPTNPGNTPQADGALQATITASDANGYATVTLKVIKDPGQRTPELDGQLYFIVVYDPDLPHIDWSKPGNPPPPQDQMISCVVFSQYAVNQDPQWEEIQTMMAPYMKLYPDMKDRINLTDLHTFTIFARNPNWHAYSPNPRTGPLGITAGAIPYYMSMPIEDPRYMPISRDLSPAKLMTLMYFVKKLQTQPDA